MAWWGIVLIAVGSAVAGGMAGAVLLVLLAGDGIADLVASILKGFRR